MVLGASLAGFWGIDHGGFFFTKQKFELEFSSNNIHSVFIFGNNQKFCLWLFRSSASSRKKEEAAEARLRAMESKLVELDLLLEQQRAETRKLERDMHASPLRALKDKLLPSSTTDPTKGDQKVVSGSTTISAPPGTRIVTLEWDDVFPNQKDRYHSSHDSSQFLPVPQWKRPFVGSTTAPSQGSDNLRSNGSSTSSTGTVSELSAVGVETNSASDSDEIRNSESVRKIDNVFTARIIRRAIKILMNAYEEIEEDWFL